MNPDLRDKAARWLITLVSGTLIGWASKRGWDIGGITELISGEIAIGVVGAGLTAAWLFMSSRWPAVTRIMDFFAKDPSTPVVGTVVAPTLEGKAIAQSVDSAVVVGTAAAAMQAGAK